MITDPFKVEQCCITATNAIQNMTSDYYSMVGPWIDDILTQVEQAETFGYPTENLYNIINEFHYLYSLLLIIYLEINQDAEWDYIYGTGCGNHQGIDYYADKYNIECLQKHFRCTGAGYDITNILDVFGMNPKAVEDGIGYMSIKYSSSVACGGTVNEFIVS